MSEISKALHGVGRRSDCRSSNDYPKTFRDGDDITFWGRVLHRPQELSGDCNSWVHRVVWCGWDWTHIDSESQVRCPNHKLPTPVDTWLLLGKATGAHTQNITRCSKKYPQRFFLQSSQHVLGILIWRLKQFDKISLWRFKQLPRWPRQITERYFCATLYTVTRWQN